jgi:hypothetical protein
MTYSLGYATSLPSIWTIAPIVDDGLACAGRQFDASNNLKDGWACVAVQASDKLGNKQVSRPIRICVVATPGSTACTATPSGGADIASISIPATLAGAVVVTTKTPVLGAGGAPVAKGDTLVFSNVSPSGISGVSGSQTVTPLDSTGTQFSLADVPVSPIDLWIPVADPSAAGAVKIEDTSYIFKGTVGFGFQDASPIQVIGTDLATVTGPVFLLTSEAKPASGDRLWPIDTVQANGFLLTDTKVSLTGFATAATVLPNCTGTVVKQTSGSTVDATKPCKPWASFPKYEALYVK